MALLYRDVLAMVRNPADVAARTLIFTWFPLITNLLSYGVTVGGGGRVLGRLGLIISLLDGRPHVGDVLQCKFCFLWTT